MKYIGLKNHIRVFYRELPGETWSSITNREDLEKQGKGELFRKILEAKTRTEADDHIKKYNQWKEDYEKVNLDIIDKIFDEKTGNTLNRDTGNFALEEVQNSLWIHDDVTKFTEKQITHLTNKLYEDVTRQKNIDDARNAIHRFQAVLWNIYFDKKYDWLWHNANILENSLGKIFDKKSEPIELEKIQNELWLNKDRDRKFREVTNPYPNTYTKLADTLKEKIFSREILSNYGDTLINYYNEKSPVYFREKALTMIQVARNIATNLPKEPNNNPFGAQSNIPKFSILEPAQSITPIESQNSERSALLDEIITHSLINAIDTDDLWKMWVGWDVIMSEYMTFDKNQKQALADWSPSNVYKMLISRYIEHLNGGNVGTPEEIAKRIRTAIVNHPSFKLNPQWEIIKMYDELIERFMALVNSGIGTKELMESMMDPDSFNPDYREFQKSLTTRWGFWIDENQKIKFYSTYEIQKSLNIWEMSNWVRSALKWYMADIQDTASAEKQIKSLFWENRLNISIFAIFLEKNSWERSKILSESSYAHLKKYFVDKWYITTEWTNQDSGIKMIGLEDIKTSYWIDIEKEFWSISWINLPKEIPINSDKTPNIPKLLDLMLQQWVSLDSCAKVKNKIEAIIKGLIIENEKTQVKKLQDIIRLMGIWSNPSISDIFQKLWVKNQPTPEYKLSWLEQASEGKILEYMKILNEKRNTLSKDDPDIKKADVFINYLQSILRWKGLKKTQDAIEGLNVSDLQKAVHGWETEWFVSKAMDLSTTDINAIKRELGESLTQNSEILRKYNLSVNLSDYIGESESNRKRLTEILKDSNLPPEEKKVLLEIEKRISSYVSQEKRVATAVSYFQAHGYNNTLGNFWEATTFVNNIPPDRLAQYQKELGITQSTQVLPDTQSSSISSFWDISSSPTSLWEIIHLLPSWIDLSHIQDIATIQKNGDTYSIQMIDHNTQKEYNPLTGVKEGELTEKLQDANTLAMMNAHCLLPHIGYIRNQLSKNPQFQKIGSAWGLSQSTHQLFSAIEILTGRTPEGSSVDERLRKFTQATTSRDIYSALQSRWVFNEVWSIKYSKLDELLGGREARINWSFISLLSPDEITSMKNLPPEDQKKLKWLYEKYHTDAWDILSFLWRQQDMSENV